MKSLAIALSCVLTINSAFAATALNGASPIYKPNPPTPRCQDFLADMQAIFKAPAKQDEALKKKQAIDIQISAEVDKQGHVIPVTATGGIVAMEDIMLLLTQPNMTETIRRKVATVQDEVFALIKKILANSKAMADMQKKPLGWWSVVKKRKFKQIEDKFIQDSMEFGAKYGYYVSVMRLLISVSKGLGAKELYEDKLPFEEPTSRDTTKMVRAAVKAIQENGVDKEKAPPVKKSRQGNAKPAAAEEAPVVKTILYNLTTTLAAQQAKDVLRYLDPQRELTWVQGGDRLTEEAALNEIEFIFRNNIYALIGKLQRDLDIQRGQRGLLSWVSMTLAGFWMGLSSYSDWLPERYRNLVLKMLIGSYDRIVVEKYLDRILTVVNTTRALDKDGNVIILNTEEKLESQLQMMLAMIGNTSTYKDFLLTYSRLMFYSGSWSELLALVKKKADAANGYSQQYANLLSWMQDAENGTKDIGPLTVLNEPSKADQIFLLTVQLGYLLAAEEAAGQGIFGGSIIEALKNLIP